MNLSDIFGKGARLLSKNSTTILTALGVSGTISTAYLASKASYRAAHVLERAPAWNTKKEDFKVVWRLYMPPVVSGALTVGCIIAATRVGSKKTAAAYSLLSVSEKAFTEYREKIVEEIGEKKEQKIRDEIAKNHILASPPATIVIGSGVQLCREAHTGRYFMSDVETLNKAVNDINFRLARSDNATLWDFYYIVGLPATSYCHNMGWDSCKPLELLYTAVMTEDKRSCISFEYNYIEPS